MATTSADAAPDRGRRWAAAAGVVAAVAGLGAGELAAAVGPTLRSPVVAVGDAVIRLAPAGVTSVAIDVLGTADKPALLAGIVVIVLAYAAGVGVVGRKSRQAGVAGAALFAVVGGAAALSASGANAAVVLPSLVAGIVAIGVLLALLAALPASRAGVSASSRPASAVAAEDPGAAPAHRDAVAAPARPDPVAASRRRFLRLTGGVAAAGLVMAVGGRALTNSLRVSEARESVTLPRPARRVALPIPDGAHPDVDGLPPFVTPNDAFYRIDTALTVPRIDPATHRVAVTGMVDRELDLAFGDLLDRELLDVPITLSCVSNEIGGDLVDTAVWRGVRLAEVLDEAGVDPRATQLVGRSTDGYTCGFPVEAAYDREALIAVGMNGQPLPAEHGFPVRLVVPGLYGYVSATKWLAEIELTTFEAFDQYWVPRGWAEQAPVKTASAIRVPQGLEDLAPGPQPIAGVAWAPHRGIRAVEVRVDDGPWQEATLGEAVSDLTWRQWSYRWEATPGRHRLSVRATDGRGQTQPEQRVDPKPDGATGWHTVFVGVRDG